MTNAYLALEAMCNLWHDYFISKEFSSFDHSMQAQIFNQWEDNIGNLMVTFQHYGQLLLWETTKVKELITAIKEEIF